MIPENSSVPAPRYTMYWLGIHTVFILVIAGILSLLALGIDSLSHSRLEAHLLPATNQTKVAISTGYSFVLITLTLFSLMLVEIAYRKPINYIQYALIGCALCLFYLLLLSITEPLQFWASYLIVSAMTIGLIGWFVHGIIREPKPVKLTVGILLAEYAVVMLLLYMGSLALLIGSLILFVILAIAMYFTLKLKVDNNELIFK